MEKDVLFLIFPCFNEEENIENTYNESKKVVEKLIQKKIISSKSKILFVDDGSMDRTWNIISKINSQDEMIQGIRLAQNRGHQMALYAGIETAVKYADAIITMDVDLQQDINAIPRFIEAYDRGSDIVLGIRNDRSSDRFLKKYSALFFYSLMQKMGIRITKNCADYRLMSRKSANALLQYKESFLFMRGIIDSFGFKTDRVFFDVTKRKYGRSKYSVRRMMRFAMDGITSFSLVPIRFIFMMGVLILLLSVFMTIYSLIYVPKGEALSSIVALKDTIWFFCGVQLVSVGIIGEYVGRIYIESKHRPRYYVEENTLSER